MRRYLFLTILFFLSTLSGAFATHNRAGEITYKQIGPLTYEITIVTYTYTLSPADRPELTVQWGDGNSESVSRIEEVYLPNDYKRNTYKGRHTYPGPGIYEIVMEDPNRNEGILNIPNSVNVPFTIKTILQINAEVGNNNTPVLLTPPIDKASVGRLFVHNPAAYDSDGDSLSYGLTVCLGENGEPIAGYTIPPASHEFYVNPVTGDLVWNCPTQTGKYNVAMLIEEWRNGVKIGKIIRDMQIDVQEAENHPPVIQDLPDLCVEAGTTIDIKIITTDQDNDHITVEGLGGPFVVEDSASFTTLSETAGKTVSEFQWTPSCKNVRNQPYEVVIKATDNADDLELVDMKSFMIKVVAPAPENLQLTPGNNEMIVSWDADYCSNAKGYYIFRRKGAYNYTHDSCETGIPESTGYKKIATVNGALTLSFLDDNDGKGLAQGYTYCYRVDAFFADGAESYISDEVCSELIRGIPIITNVSVLTTDSLNGKMFVAWSKPTDFDTINFPGPYEYKVWRSEGLYGENLHLVATLHDINDTIFYDSLLNTKHNPYSYKIEFYNVLSGGNEVLIGHPQIASSVFVKTRSDDKRLHLDFEKNVPWINEKYVVYRENDTNGFDSIGVTSSVSYIDENLTNGNTYCYKVKSIGHYNIDSIIDPIINYSQKACGTPKDTIPPNPISFRINSLCNDMENVISWTLPNIEQQGIVYYNIYYSPIYDQEPELLATVDNPQTNEYVHTPSESMAGCYIVTAVDSAGNESSSPKVCIDSCSYYELPNVFTPNGSPPNDIFHPGPYKFVDHIDLKIFNRWGTLVFETTNPDINWNGEYLNTGKLVTTGVYYYICDVYEHRLTGIVPRNITGFIHVFTNGRNQPAN
jgi:gliding motility-associated-like protein